MRLALALLLFIRRVDKPIVWFLAFFLVNMAVAGEANTGLASSIPIVAWPSTFMGDLGIDTLAFTLTERES